MAAPVTTADETRPEETGQARHDRRSAGTTGAPELGDAVGTGVTGAARAQLAEGLSAPRTPILAAEATRRLPRRAAATVLAVALGVRQGPAGPVTRPPSGAPAALVARPAADAATVATAKDPSALTAVAVDPAPVRDPWVLPVLTRACRQGVDLLPTVILEADPPAAAVPH